MDWEVRNNDYEEGPEPLRSLDFTRSEPDATLHDELLLDNDTNNWNMPDDSSNDFRIDINNLVPDPNSFPSQDDKSPQQQTNHIANDVGRVPQNLETNHVVPNEPAPSQPNESYPEIRSAQDFWNGSYHQHDGMYPEIMPTQDVWNDPSSQPNGMHHQIVPNEHFWNEPYHQSHGMNPQNIPTQHMRDRSYHQSEGMNPQNITTQHMRDGPSSQSYEINHQIVPNEHFWNEPYHQSHGMNPQNIPTQHMRDRSYHQSEGMNPQNITTQHMRDGPSSQSYEINHQIVPNEHFWNEPYHQSHGMNPQNIPTQHFWNGPSNQTHGMNPQIIPTQVMKDEPYHEPHEMYPMNQPAPVFYTHSDSFVQNAQPKSVTSTEDTWKEIKMSRNRSAINKTPRYRRSKAEIALTPPEEETTWKLSRERINSQNCYNRKKDKKKEFERTKAVLTYGRNQIVEENKKQEAVIIQKLEHLKNFDATIDNYEIHSKMKEITDTSDSEHSEELKALKENAGKRKQKTKKADEEVRAGTLASRKFRSKVTETLSELELEVLKLEFEILKERRIADWMCWYSEEVNTKLKAYNGL